MNAIPSPSELKDLRNSALIDEITMLLIANDAVLATGNYVKLNIKNPLNYASAVRLLREKGYSLEVRDDAICFFVKKN